MCCTLGTHSAGWTGCLCQNSLAALLPRVCVCMCVCVRTRVMGEGGSLLPGGFVLCWFQALAEPRGGEDTPVAREKLRLRGSRDLATVLELRSATLASGERATVTLGSISVPGGTETDHAQSNCCEPWVGGVGGAGRTSR